MNLAVPLQHFESPCDVLSQRGKDNHSQCPAYSEMWLVRFVCTQRSLPLLVSLLFSSERAWMDFVPSVLSLAWFVVAGSFSLLIGVVPPPPWRIRRVRLRLHHKWFSSQHLRVEIPNGQNSPVASLQSNFKEDFCKTSGICSLVIVLIWIVETCILPRSV